MWSALTKLAVNGQRGVYVNVSRRLMNEMPQQHLAASVPLWNAKPLPKQQVSREVDDLLDCILARCTPLPSVIADTDRFVYQSEPSTSWNIPTNEMRLGGYWCVDPSLSESDGMSCTNRNARRPNKANHGARPCSRSSRRWKKEKIGKRRRG